MTKTKEVSFFFSFTFLSTSDSEKRKACSQLSRFRKGERSFFPDSFFFTFPSCLRARTPSFHFFFFWNKVNSRHTLLFDLQPGFSTSKGKRTLTTGRISVVFFFLLLFWQHNNPSNRLRKLPSIAVRRRSQHTRQHAHTNRQTKTKTRVFACNCFRSGFLGFACFAFFFF